MIRDCDCPGASRLNYVIPFSRPRDKQSLNQSSFGEGQGGAAGHDEMVQDLDVYQGQCLLERLRQHFVGMAGLGHAGWMVVRENHCGSVAGQSAFDDFARIDAGLACGAAKYRYWEST